MTTLKISQIEVQSNPRKDFSGVDDLAASIGSCGLLQPIAVRPDGAGKYILVDGEQRLRAFKKLKREEIPVYVLSELETQEAKEAQMTANLMRSDLSFVERARGFAMLLENAPAKYNEKVIANRFGLKEKEVKQMVILIRKITPEVDIDLGSGQAALEDLESVALCPKEFQPAVVKGAMKNGGNVSWAIRELTAELYFDDVFKKEQARAAGKIHYERYGTCLTFDKAYAAKVKTEFEARTKKSYAKEKEKSKALSAKEAEKQAKQKKESREKQKIRLADLCQEIRVLLPRFLAKPVNPETIAEMRENFISGRSGYGLMAEDAKLLLKGHGIEFKASELGTADLRKLVDTKILDQHLKSEANLVNLYEWLAINHGFTTLEDPSGFKTWIARMKKSVSGTK